MSVHPIGDFEPVPNRPGRAARDLMGSEHGFDSLFLTETVIAPGSAIPLHTHTVEEGWVVLEGRLAFRVGDESVTAGAGTVVRVAPGVPHAVVNSAGLSARALTAAPWPREGFYRDATTYL
ncbi:MAG TPA: cupin domain-containing protein, partial [Dehalococcoidia bacterium]